MTLTIPSELRDSLPDYVSLDACEVLSYADLCAAHDVSDAPAGIDPAAPVVVLPGWVADDGNAAVEYPDAPDGATAAQEYVDTGFWGDDDSGTSWIRVHAWRAGIVLAETGEPVDLIIDRETHSITLEATVPPCTHEGGHDWRSPYGVVGGIQENPGVWGHGGGVVIKEVCAHCGAYKVTDTWAQDPSTGEQGLTSVSYAEADEASMEWVLFRGRT